MKLLLRKATVADPSSSYHGQQVDLLIAGGRIAALGASLDRKADREIDLAGAMVSPGWIDITVQTGDPGYEHREDLESAMAAAVAGGFTGIGCLPNTDPVADSKAGIHYLRQADRGKLVDLFPIGAVSVGCRGRDITEMLDMHRAGAVAFSDGDRPLADSGLLLRALQYTTAFGGVVMNQALDGSVAPEGQMHEGLTSTSLGLPGLPSLGEFLMVDRDLKLLAYSGGRLHLANVSTAEGVEAVRVAKSRGLRVSCSVAAHNLLFTDEDLAAFDTNLKVLPPLRSASDRAALIEGLKDRTIDVISGNHVPVEEERKKVEFPFAAFGATGLETAFALARTATAEELELDLLLEGLVRGPRRLFGLPDPRIEEGQPANLTLFDPDRSWRPARADLRSRSSNSPALGLELRGRPLGVVNHGLVDYSGPELA